MTFEGGCHCGNIRLLFQTSRDPDRLPVLACQCSFCRKHNTLATADPEGVLSLAIRSVSLVNRYRFGLSTADYLICRTCGVYTAAIADGAPERGLVVVNALDQRDLFCAEPAAISYDGETADDRRIRRSRNWTPVKWEDELTRGS